MTRPHATRAFALPLVIMLSLVVSLLMAVMLERQTAQSLTVVRQIKGYQSHHTELGVRQLVDGWLKSISAKLLDNLTEEQEHVLDIKAGDLTYKVYLGEAQGRVLLRFDGLEGQQLSRARAIAKALGATDEDRKKNNRTRNDTAADEQTYDDGTRDAGPVDVSIRTASREAIVAVAVSVIDDEQLAGDLADRLIALRKRDELTDTTVATVAAELGMENDQRTTLQTLLTNSPRLYSVRTRIEDRDGDLIAEYEGLTQFQSGQQGVGQAVSKGSQFLSWRTREPIDDE